MIRKEEIYSSEAEIQRIQQGSEQQVPGKKTEIDKVLPSVRRHLKMQRRRSCGVRLGSRQKQEEIGTPPATF